VYATLLKKMPWRPQGLEKLKRWKASIGNIPLVAISTTSEIQDAAVILYVLMNHPISDSVHIVNRKRLAVEFGMGTDLRGEDYTKAACRALNDAIRHNALTVCDALGYERDEMIVEVNIGVARPDKVDKDKVASMLPYGTSTVTVVEGGLDIPNAQDTGKVVVANAAAAVYLDIDSA
jgi:uncharacterized protein (TIGR02058 family)